jgi:hypothetical protein
LEERRSSFKEKPIYKMTKSRKEETSGMVLSGEEDERRVKKLRTAVEVGKMLYLREEKRQSGRENT